MSMPLLIASILVGILVTCVGIYRAYTQGEFMPLVLGMLILMSCAANYLKRLTKEEDGEDQSTDEAANG
jgi:flagellar biosynthesis protein FliQ